MRISDIDLEEEAWLGLDKQDLERLRTLPNPLLVGRTDIYREYPGLFEMQIMRQPDYLWWTAKTLFNIDLLPYQMVIMEELWVRPFPMLICSRGAGKSFLLALLALLKCILIPETKVVGVGGAFRQSKIIFEYMVNIWQNAPIARSICTDNSGPRLSPDRCLLKINDSSAMFVPLGDGSKIRGLRSSVILSDEFSCLSKTTLVETNQGLIRIGEDDCRDKQLYTGNEILPYETPAKYIKTPLMDVYEIQMSNGYAIRCSENHKVMTQDGWKKPLELTNDDYIESDNNYKFPNKQTLNKKTAWLLGILISEGSVNHKYKIQITTTDENLKNFIINNYGFKAYSRPAYINNLGWRCKKSYGLYKNNLKFRQELYEYGLDYTTAHGKKIPREILKQPRHIIMAFLKGLFEGDGTCYLFKNYHKNNELSTCYYSVSEQLCRDVQVVLDKLGYNSHIHYRNSKVSKHKQWMVRLSRMHVYNFTKQLNIRRFAHPLKNCDICSRPSNMVWNKNTNRWEIYFTRLNKRIYKSFKDKTEAVEYLEYLKSLPRFRKVKSVKKLSKQEHLYDYHLPVTHSYYAGGSRNHNSIPPDIFETVVQGFAAVSSSPVENVKDYAKRAILKKKGKWSRTKEKKYQAARSGNQIIISGTADYDFGHFADYWKKYCAIINSKGNRQKFIEDFGGEDDTMADSFNWKDFSVIRLPYELIPKGFMDDKVIARAKATIHSGTYNCEYGAIFEKDSDGFFKRSLIESCVTSEKKPVVLPSGEIWFDANVHGNSAYDYVYGIDPAADVDHFAIIVLELHSDHARVVYSWTTNKDNFKQRIRAGVTDVIDYHTFCVRKIRDLMKIFPCKHISMDKQGGGSIVMETLHDKDKIYPGELPIWEIIDYDKEKDTDGESGLHILEMVQFADYNWVAEANHGLRKDLENKVLLFPRFDPVTLELANAADTLKIKSYERAHPGKSLTLYDSLEDCVMEIEELKNEMTSIVVTRTGTGVQNRDRWDTPEVKTVEGRKGRLRKDRYSALLMASMAARQIHRELPAIEYEAIGGFSHEIDTKERGGNLYHGPDWFVKGMNNLR